MKNLSMFDTGEVDLIEDEDFHVMTPEEAEAAWKIAMMSDEEFSNLPENK